MSRGGRRRRSVDEARARVAELEARPVLDEAAVARTLFVVAQAQAHLNERAQAAIEAAVRQGHFELGGVFSPVHAVGSTT